MIIIKTITNIKKVKKNYALYVGDDIYIIDSYFYECFLPYNGKELKKNDLDLLSSFNEGCFYLNRVYRKLFTSSLSTYDFKKGLKIKNIDDDKIEIITKYLKKEGLLNDTSFVNHYLEIYQINKGKKAFKTFLIKNHIHEDLINKALDNFNEDKEMALILANNYIKNKNCSTNMLKYKVQAMLVNKGFSEKTVEYVVAYLDKKDERIALNKEINKLIAKYDDYKIMAKLQAKGYRIDLIKELLQERRKNHEN